MTTCVELVLPAGVADVAVGMRQMLQVCVHALGVLHGVCHTRSQSAVLGGCWSKVMGVFNTQP